MGPNETERQAKRQTKMQAAMICTCMTYVRVYDAGTAVDDVALSAATQTVWELCC
jgi:hypothetical protein